MTAWFIAKLALAYLALLVVVWLVCEWGERHQINSEKLTRRR